MSAVNVLERIARREHMSQEDLVRAGVVALLSERRQEYLQDQFEILSRYDVRTVEELRTKIENGEAPEHPGWEDLIEARNVEFELRQIEDDLRALRQTE